MQYMDVILGIFGAAQCYLFFLVGEYLLDIVQDVRRGFVAQAIFAPFGAMVCVRYGWIVGGDTLGCSYDTPEYVFLIAPVAEIFSRYAFFAILMDMILLY